MRRKKEKPSSKKLFDDIKTYKSKRFLAGISLIFLGILGILLPILPGWATIFVGLVLIFPRWGKKMINKIVTLLKLDQYEIP